MRIYGSGDDLVEIDGVRIREEFNIADKASHGVVLAISNGDLLRARYENDGVWRFTTLALGHLRGSRIIPNEMRPEPAEGRENYSDLVDIDESFGEIEWVVVARSIKRAPKR